MNIDRKKWLERLDRKAKERASYFKMSSKGGGYASGTPEKVFQTARASMSRRNKPVSLAPVNLPKEREDKP